MVHFIGSLFFLLLALTLAYTANQTVFQIANVVLDIPNAVHDVINGTCQECLCDVMTSRNNITSFNCFEHNKTCQLFSAALNTPAITIRNQSSATFYFFTLFHVDTVTTTVSTDETISAGESTALSTTSTEISSSATSSEAKISSTSDIMTSAQPQTSTVSATSSTQFVTSPTPSTMVPSTSMGPFSFTYSNLPCTTLSTSFIAYDKQNASTTPKIVQHNFTATTNIAVLAFAIQTDNHMKWYIDDVRVVLINNRSHSLLINGDFEYGNLTGWNAQNCPSQCNNGGQISQSSSCNGTYCYYVPDNCRDYQFLQQAFPTTPNQQYEVSFLIYATGGGTGGGSGGGSGGGAGGGSGGGGAGGGSGGGSGGGGAGGGGPNKVDARVSIR